MKKLLIPALLVVFFCCNKSADFNSVADKNISLNSSKNSSDFQSQVSAQSFSSVVIGTKTWMTTNLAVTQYRNGDPIAYLPYIGSDRTWQTTTSGAYCAYNNDSKAAATYGLLYNGYAMMDPRGLAPKGWHIATADDWNQLITALGRFTVGGQMKAVSSLWKSPNTSATNSSGFTGLPAGYRSTDQSGTFYAINQRAYFWSYSSYTVQTLSYNTGSLTHTLFGANTGASVRCVKD